MDSHIPENTSKNTHHVVADLLFEDNSIKKVLDIPSGHGAFTNRLLKKNVQVYSSDIENILMVKNENFHMADMNKTLPYQKDFFSAVVCIDGIEHLENPFYFIRECNRVLEQGGWIILSTPNISSLRSRWRWMLTGHHNKCKNPLNEEKPTPLHHINMLSFPRMRYILHTNGFTIEKITTNRIKAVSYIYALFVPLAYLMTRFVYNKEEKDKGQKIRNKEILKQMFSSPILFGETMIIKARKTKSI